MEYQGKRIRIPGCWGAAVAWEDDDWGASHCTCYNSPGKRRKASAIKRLKATIRRLEKKLQAIKSKQ